MDTLERQAIRELNTVLITDLDPKYIGPYLYEKKYLSQEQLLELLNRDRPLIEACQIFLLKIVDMCPFHIFLKALRYEKAYPHLADSLEKKLDSLKEDYRIQRDGNSPLFASVEKVKVNIGYRKQLATLAHELKRLLHEGNNNTFRRVTESIRKKCPMHNFRDSNKATDKMKQADIRFIVLDAEIEARRLKYDVTLYQSDVFQSMKDLIPYTTNPTVSSMTFLARYGSSLSMKESIDSGLNQLHVAKQHATQVQPCKDTGMVFYIEINLLFQQYVNSPKSSLKENILKMTDLAISHFNEDEFGRDYQRMLLLKKAFCHLGIGLFGERIPDAVVDNQDMTSAGDCLDFVEKNLWDGIEARRKMFFMIAKSEMYRRQNNKMLAKMHAKKANKIAQKNEWKKEAVNITHFLHKIDSTNKKHISDRDDVECIEKCVDDIFAPNDDDYYEKDSFLPTNKRPLIIADRAHKSDNFSTVYNGSCLVFESSVDNHIKSETITTTEISKRPLSVGNNDIEILVDNVNDKVINDKQYFTGKMDYTEDDYELKCGVTHQAISDKVPKEQTLSDLKDGSFVVVDGSVDNRFDNKAFNASLKSKQMISVINVDPNRLDDYDDNDDQLDLIAETEGTVVHKESFVNGTPQSLIDRVFINAYFSDEKNGYFGALESSEDNDLNHQANTILGINECLVPISNVNDRLNDCACYGDNMMNMTDEIETAVFVNATPINVKTDCLKGRIHNGDNFLDPKNMMFTVMESSVDSLLNHQTRTTFGESERPTSASSTASHILNDDDDDDDDDDDGQLDLIHANEDGMVDKEPFVNVAKSPYVTDMVQTCNILSDVQKGSFGVGESLADNYTGIPGITTQGSNEELASIVRFIKPDRLDDGGGGGGDGGDNVGKLNLKEENNDIVVYNATVKNVRDLRRHKLNINIEPNKQKNTLSDTMKKQQQRRGDIARLDWHEPCQKKIKLTEWS